VHLSSSYLANRTGAGRHVKHLLTSICIALLCASLASGVVAQALERKIVYELAAQPLADAITALAAQSKLRIVFNTQDTIGLTSARLSGTYTPKDALGVLLANSNLRYEFLDDQTIAIHKSLESTRQE
jgi:Secretin and TonB N terminus short domain